jgi:hypothetical protein
MRPVGVGLAGLQSRWHVTQGSYELGCSEGTVLDHPLAGDEEFGAGGVQQVFTRTDGKRSGSFVIRWDGKAILGFAWERSWNFHGGTNDYAEVNGKACRPCASSSTRGP